MPGRRRLGPTSAKLPRKPRYWDALFEEDMHVFRRSRDASDNPTETELNSLLTPPPPLEDRLRDLKQPIALLLVEEGYPNPFEKVLVDGQAWRPFPKGWTEMPIEERSRKFVRHGEKISPGSLHIEEHSPPLSNAWFGARLFNLIVGFEHAKPAARASLAYDIGHLIATWRSRSLYRSVSAGRRVRKGASDAGTQKSQRFRTQRERILKRMQELVSKGHSVSRAAEIAAAQGVGTSKAANRNIWHRHRKKL